MSTLAAARADNMYFPPEWRPEYGGISKFQGSNGHNQYEKYGKIRFELPVHGWCLGCGRHIGRGTRFNATKDQVGTYYSTKIWQFSMRCPSCSTVMVIKTDPKNTDYEYVEGIRKKDVAFDPEEAETQRVQDSEVSQKLAVDPLYRLEHEQSDKRRAASRKTVLTRLTELSDAHGQDDYSSNARLRQAMRKRKRKELEREEEAKAKGLGIRLETPSPADAEAAREIKYRGHHKGFRTREKAKMASITSESIFGTDNETPEQARRKRVLVKAAKLGLKATAMRLLKPSEGSWRGAGAVTRHPHVSSSSTRSSGRRSAADEHGLRTGDKRTPTRTAIGAGGVAVVGVGDDSRIEDRGSVIDGRDDELACERVRGSRADRDAETSTKKATAARTKKRRKRGSSSKLDSSVAALQSDGGLAAIASLY